ncbi:hypothetical protein J3R30DRAFT_3693914 [Lentinula aciculospora]|uniref:Uncharacterized protein n=1 Tax=Lentinula aciculospora TaxID=153920 RepID=A0A9W9AWP5_9AGAR|nr:hypothetical protein J3R30DRAFT_3693914 [Lentinula aciculospora]
MHLPIPCSSPVEIPSFLGFSPKLSSSTCSLYLLSFIGFVVLGVAITLKFIYMRKSRSKQERVALQTAQKEQNQVLRRKWSSLLGSWDSATWPVILTASPPSTSVGRGVGLNGAILGKQMSQPMRNVDQPLPTIYQSKEPVSMAKMIMSRHTFRRPSTPAQRPCQSVPRRPAPLPPASSSKPHSMV